MMDQLIAIKDKIVAFWNKYTTRQKTIIICVVLAVFFALVLLSYFLTRPVYTHLATFSDAGLANTLSEALEGKNIKHEMNTDASGTTSFEVEQSDYSEAVLAMGANGIVDKEMTWETALESDMTTSSLEKHTKITLALQSSIKENLLNFAGVQDATVIIDRPEDDKTFIAATKEASVSVTLRLAEGKEMERETATAMAYYLTNAVGNKTTDNIVIVDTAGNLLYGAKTDNTLGGTVSGIDDYKSKLQQTFAERTRKMLLKAGYDDAEVSSMAIKFNMDQVEELITTYSVGEGQDQGYYSSSYEYSSNGQSGSGGVPGTDSNGEDTDYMLQNNGTTNSETILNKYNYLPNEDVQNIKREVGAVVPEESSIGIILTRYRKVSEETLEEQGALNDISFDEYIEQNSQVNTLETPEDLLPLVAAATGIAENRISIRIQEKPVFEAKEDTGLLAGGFTNYLMIILAVLIGALLIFVIIRGTSPVEVTELEPELSVEDLLATTREDEKGLEEIEMGEKSETRTMIEKFVDENPEAVAMLLRNWINEDWG
jgi:Flagellar biosynthesis/type III secretory pathway lipoprotein